nr:PREDICTED: hypermethylated in cancer 1 protein-like isoform X1 [Latimeria chalumnae]XP_006013327.1 PREDICTED: hypermethylated in cancer 1 protein-like isoform X1 [Latimeria chalumnae]|eukprot:XP_006013326.2 PREDICTED: hypermethylated in cancer 1 protein-like isoform X1 [Latimeria chalumnae]
MKMDSSSHATQLLLHLNNQRGCGFLCDVVVVVENSLFYAHKNVLAACSGYFRPLVATEDLIHLDQVGVTATVFQQILNFMYTGDILSSLFEENNLKEVLAVANCLKLRDLAFLCRSKLGNGTKPVPKACRAEGLEKTGEVLRKLHSPVIQPHVLETSQENQAPDLNLRTSIAEEEEAASLHWDGKPSCGTASEFAENPGQGCGSEGASQHHKRTVAQSSMPAFSSLNAERPESKEAKRTCPKPKPILGLPENGLIMDIGQSQLFCPCTYNLGVPMRNGVIRCPVQLKEVHTTSTCSHCDYSKPEGKLPDHTSVLGSAGLRDGTSGCTRSKHRLEDLEGDDLYLCIQCGRDFPNSMQLEAHLKAGMSPSNQGNVGDSLSARVPRLAGSGSECQSGKGRSLILTGKEETLRQRQSEAESPDGTKRFYACWICGRAFTQRGTLNRHVRTHLGVKPYSCPECGMKFTRQYRVSEHLRVHGLRRAFQCERCGEKFKVLHQLTEHKKSKLRLCSDTLGRRPLQSL